MIDEGSKGDAAMLKIGEHIIISKEQELLPEPIPAPEIEELDNCIATIQRLKLSL